MQLVAAGGDAPTELPDARLVVLQALERISVLLEHKFSSITVAERGDVACVPRHPNFRLFGAMNPATDAGKRELPAPLRNRFTEIWVGEPTQREDLAAIVAGYLLPVAAAAPVHAVVDFYLAAKAEAVRRRRTRHAQSALDTPAELAC
jgi:midasin